MIRSSSRNSIQMVSTASSSLTCASTRGTLAYHKRLVGSSRTASRELTLLQAGERHCVSAVAFMVAGSGFEPPTFGLGCTYRSPGSAATAGSECGQRPISPHRWWSYSGGKKTPDLIAVLHCLLERDTAGDPMTGGLAVPLPPSRKSWLNSALPSPPIPSLACSIPWAILCGSIKSRSPPVRVPTAIFSSNISPSCATASSAVICPSSASTAKNASSSAISKILAAVGNQPHSGGISLVSIGRVQYQFSGGNSGPSPAEKYRPSSRLFGNSRV